MQRNSFEIEARARKVKALVLAARRTTLTVEQVSSLTQYQWERLAEIATDTAKRRIEPPHTQETKNQVVAQMLVDDRLSSIGLDEIFASFKV